MAPKGVDDSLGEIDTSQLAGVVPAGDGAVGIAGVAHMMEFPTDPGSLENTVSVWSITDQLSVRSDWSSTQGDDVGLGLTLSDAMADIQCTGLVDANGENSFSVADARMRTTRQHRPMRVGVHSIQNLRREMEDIHRVVLGASERSHPSGRGGSGHSTLGRTGFNSTGRSPRSLASAASSEAPLGAMSFFAVFDGHGGSRAAEFSGERLCALLAAEVNAAGNEGRSSETSEALRRAFSRTDDEWLSIARQDELMDGTTAAVVLVDRARSRCIVGNVGDSEVLLGTLDEAGNRSFRPLTEVHHGGRNASEAQRVESVGGRIWKGRVSHPEISPQVLSLAVSRAIGDLFFKDKAYTSGKESGLTADPYIATVELGNAGVVEQFLVIGCDGLWDKVSYAAVADVTFNRLRNGEDPQAISEALVRFAREMGSSDNITVMVVAL
eukprot:TRINITY_DN17610_c0_g1_i1.p1 TRINITY_DN17610_c0_g1~~TRINITY_DN17610_c0_g1_i1.p1  ORF type:complete len:439 (+),score=69.55 TRINITY_DN17610_c0_g1_i1:92-1408(+)